jgi:superfamily I DNA and/or RNA helicase
VLSRFGVRRAALIGDPLQLPTQLHQCFGRVERAQAQRGLGRAMFSRLASSGSSVVMLKRQYRCHPKLSALSNALFYGNQLIDCAEPEQVSPLFASLPTLALFDVCNGAEEITKTGSFINAAEAAAVVQLVVQLQRRGVDRSKIGIIALYKAQALFVADKLAELDVASVVATDVDTMLLDEPPPHEPTADASNSSSAVATNDGGGGGDIVQVATVDAFQGAEKEIVILTTTRASLTVGFLESSERLNVALTRARRHLLIVGNRKTLEVDAQWRFVVQQCADSGAIREIADANSLRL